MGAQDGILRLLESMAAIDAQKGVVVGAFDAVFYQYEGALVELCQIIEQLIRHAIRACAYDDAHNIVYLQRLVVKRLELVEWGIGVGEGLEIGQILHIRILVGEELLALFELLGYRVATLAIRGVERAVVAIDATTSGNASIAIRTGKTCIDRNLLHTIGKLTANPRAVVVIIGRIHFI